MRVVIAGLAVIVCVWYGLGIRQAHDVAAATRIIEGQTPVARTEAAHATELLDTAGTLNPDRTVDILRAYLALDDRDLPRARQVLLPVVRAEPQNLEAWFALAQASVGAPRIASMAYDALSRLRPGVR